MSRLGKNRMKSASFKESVPVNASISQPRPIGLPIAMTAFGILVGVLSLALVSNRFGNTDVFGIVFFGVAGWILVAGISLFFIRFRYAAAIGLAAAPLAIVLLFILYWSLLFVTVFQNRGHRDFAANGVAQIQPAKQMDERYDDCRHYITYGQDNVPLLNTVAYFGDRYELTMQVPVKIHSKESGETIGEPKFYLNQISNVSVSPSGQVTASFSGGLEFGPNEWKQVYESNGDFSKIGFNINSAGVPNFKKYTDASRPSD